MRDSPNRDLCRALIDCSQSGDLAGVISLLGQGADPSYKASNALRVAAEAGHAECVKVLLPFSAPKDNNSALGLAAGNGHAECVRLLIPVSDPKAYGSHPLHAAAFDGHAECVKLLIPVSEPKARDSEALVSAARNNRAECIKLLIPVSDPKSDNSRALAAAAMFGSAECVKLLLPVSDPKHNSRALQGAIDHTNTECVKLLIPVSGPLLKRKKIRTLTLSLGHADILSLLLAFEPLLLTGLDLPRCRDASTAKGHVEMAALLSSIIEQQDLVGTLPQPTPGGGPTTRRL